MWADTTSLIYHFDQLRAEGIFWDKDYLTQSWTDLHTFRYRHYFHSLQTITILFYQELSECTEYWHLDHVSHSCFFIIMLFIELYGWITHFASFKVVLKVLKMKILTGIQILISALLLSQVAQCQFQVPCTSQHAVCDCLDKTECEFQLEITRLLDHGQISLKMCGTEVLQLMDVFMVKLSL